MSTLRNGKKRILPSRTKRATRRSHLRSIREEAERDILDTLVDDPLSPTQPYSTSPTSTSEMPSPTSPGNTSGNPLCGEDLDSPRDQVLPAFSIVPQATAQETRAATPPAAREALPQGPPTGTLGADWFFPTPEQYRATAISDSLVFEQDMVNTVSNCMLGQPLLNDPTSYRQLSDPTSVFYNNRAFQLALLTELKLIVTITQRLCFEHEAVNYLQYLTCVPQNQLHRLTPSHAHVHRYLRNMLGMAWDSIQTRYSPNYRTFYHGFITPNAHVGTCQIPISLLDNSEEEPSDNIGYDMEPDPMEVLSTVATINLDALD